MGKQHPRRGNGGLNLPIITLDGFWVLIDETQAGSDLQKGCEFKVKYYRR